MKALKWLLILVSIIVLFIGGALVWTGVKNASASKRWLASPAPPGVMIDVGGNRLYAVVMGKGGPAVIIEPSLGSTSPEWRHIQEALSKKTAVLCFDRAGYGWSDPGAMPRTGAQELKELWILLKKTGLKPPYILLGHEQGALYLEIFARAYPREVAGAVMIDPVSAGNDRFKKELDPAVYSNLIDKRPSLKAASFLARRGLVRAFKAVPYTNLPPELKVLVIENYSLSKTYEAMLDEYRHRNEDIARLPSYGAFPPVPLVVFHHSPERYLEELHFYGLSRDEAQRIESIWRAMHHGVAMLSPRGRMIVMKKGLHSPRLEEPETIVRAVSEMLRAAP